MANGILGQILGSVLGGARGGLRAPVDGGAGAGTGGGLGDVLGGNRGALLAMLLPLAMQWVQRNGGLGAVLQRFRQQGYAPQANSWMSTGPNQPIAPEAVGEVVGMDELSRLSQQLGVSDQEVAQGFAQIMPEMVDHLTPEGEVPPDADQVLDRGRSSLEQLLRQAGLH